MLAKQVRLKVRRGDGNRGCRHLISAQSFARAARRGQDDRQDMLVGKEEPLCTFCVWPWPSCVCVCVGDVPHTGAVHLRPCVLKDLLRSRGRVQTSAFSHSQNLLSSVRCHWICESTTLPPVDVGMQHAYTARLVTSRARSRECV